MWSRRRWAPCSAGSAPKGLNPFTIRVLEQERMDVSGFHSKSMDEFAGQRFDYVITLCDEAAEACPVFPGNPEHINWSFVDPAAFQGSDVEKLTVFQAVLREMRQRIALFIPVAKRAAEPDLSPAELYTGQPDKDPDRLVADQVQS
jgi:arsenate reductase